VFKFKVVANMVRSEKEGQQLFAKLSKVSDRFLNVALDLVGVIPFDENIRRSVRKQVAIVEAFPESPAAKGFRTLAETVNQWPIPNHASGHLEFFIERLLEN
jgi:flagellar biosynthesis protein FlhG